MIFKPSAPSGAEGIFMEMLAAALPGQEQLKSFDVLASVNLLRFDLQCRGFVLPETMRRVYDEELSFIAEGINRPIYTEFTLRDINGQLSYFDKGEWRPYLSTLMRGLEVANQESQLDPRKQFLADRAAHDLQIGYQLLGLAPGETLAWGSPFPHNAYRSYGRDLVDQAGFQSHRLMGYLYHARRNQDGSLTLCSQSVDNSHEAAFRMALAVGSRPGNTIEDMREAYDEMLEREGEGTVFYAGRPLEHVVPEENAWTAIVRHKDLLDYYFNQLTKLAAKEDMSRPELERAKKRLTFSLWAALKNRLDRAATAPDKTRTWQSHDMLQQEMDTGYRRAIALGEMLFGCGGMLKGEEALLSADSNEVFDAIFGKEEKKMKCVTCPFCKKTVDAIQTKHSISCPECKASVSK